MKQFVPMTDDMLFDAQQFVGPFVPYRYGVPCVRQMRDEDAQRDVQAERNYFATDNASPGLTPSLSAMPALSSSTYFDGPSLG